MIARVDTALAVAVGTLGGLGIAQQDPTGILSSVPEWLMPSAMIIVGLLYGWNMWLANERAKNAPAPITREDLAKMEERIAASNKENLTLVATAIKELHPLVQGVQQAVSDLRVAVAEIK